MTAKTKLILKWVFVFSVLSLWSYFVVVNSIIGSFVEDSGTSIYIQNIPAEEANYETMNALTKDFNIPFYEKTTAGIEKASFSQIIGILFNHNFEIQEKTQEIVADKCSLRAEKGNLEVNSEDFGGNNKLSFNVNYLKNGEGSLTAQKDRDRFSLSFEVKEILETNSEKLIFRAGGKGRLNGEEFSSDNVIVTFDKINNIVNVAGEGNLSFNAEGMQVTFTEGCFDEKKDFYLIINKGKLAERRSIEEIRLLLDQYPGMIDMYEGLGRLYKDYWWAGLPSGFIVS